MSFGGLRIVEDTPYNSMAPSGAMSHHPSLNESFNSPGLSLALKTGIEGQGDVSGTRVVTDENFQTNNGSGGVRRSRDEEHEYRSGSDNFEGVSCDDRDIVADYPPRKKRIKRYHRHTPQQIQELESVFKECPHPDEKQRLELSKRLCLETRQVKFWFQNRRTMMKTQLERHENSLLRQENDKLRAENMSIRGTMSNPICANCGGPTNINEFRLEEHQLRIENARLKQEIDRISLIANKFLGRPIPSVSTLTTLSNSISTPQMPSSALELGVNNRTNCFNNPLTNSFPLAPDFNTMPTTVLSPTKSTADVASIDRSFERSMYFELALGAMDELVKMAQVDEPLWLRSIEPGGPEVLNHDEYMRCFSPCIGLKPNGYVTEATRETGVVILNSLALVETLMDPNRWVDMFPGLIAGTSTMEVIARGMGGTRNGSLQLMHAEFQVLSPMVPVRVVSFLRYSKQHAEGVWGVVDVSVDCIIRESCGSPSYVNCRRLPSGCLIQDMHNGCSKVTWVEHAEYDENVIHNLYRPLISSGMGFGAQKWLTTLQRQCQCLATLMSSSFPSHDHTGISGSGRRSMLKLAQRMTSNFCAGVCASKKSQKWSKLNMNNVDEKVQVMTRKSIYEPGEPPGIVLSAVTSVWLSVSPQRLFDFLRDESLRSEWDILSNGSPMHEIVRVSKGRHDIDSSVGGANCVSILRACDMNTNDQNSMLILQETCSDITGSLVVYAPIDTPAMHVLMSGADSSEVSLLPSGFAIAPGPTSSGPECNDSTTGPVRPSGGSLLTVGFQILVNSLPTAKLTVESVETVSHLISCTLQKIKGALV